MIVNSVRPFYGKYAWAYDLLIERPVRKECAAITDWLVERGVRPGSRILDAGCGTGRYCAELARRGYLVEGVDRSPDLIRIARDSAAGPSASFRVDDLLDVPPTQYDAILCRGVLNDFIDDDQRHAVLAVFAKALRPGGVLILDVRDWHATTERKQREPVFRKSVVTDRGKMTFTSTTALDPDNRQLLVSENHTLAGEAGIESADYQFVMKCWTRPELESGLERSGFRDVEYFSAYDPSIAVGQTDRVVAVAWISAAEDSI